MKEFLLFYFSFSNLIGFVLVILTLLEVHGLLSLETWDKLFFRKHSGRAAMLNYMDLNVRRYTVIFLCALMGILPIWLIVHIYQKHQQKKIPYSWERK